MCVGHLGWGRLQVINACAPHRQWKGVGWVFQQMKSQGIGPNSATYGLAIEVEQCSERTIRKPLGMVAFCLQPTGIFCWT